MDISRQLPLYTCSSTDQSEDIVDRDENHKRKEKDQARRVDISLILRIDRFSPHKLNEQEDQSSAVQRWQGEQIEHTQVDGNKGHQQG